jgi:hypothetical protein
MTREKTAGWELPAAAVAGAALLALGLALAAARLPEWQSGPIPAKSWFAARYRLLAARAGIPLGPERPALYLETKSDETRLAGEAAHGAGGDPTITPGGSLYITASQMVSSPGAAARRRFEVSFSPQGEPLAVAWLVPGPQVNATRIASDADGVRFASLLLRPGETTGPPRRTVINGNVVLGVPIVGQRQHLAIFLTLGDLVAVQRRAGDAGLAIANGERFFLGSLASRHVTGFLFFLLAVVVFLILLAQRRLDLAHGAVLGAVAFVATAPSFLAYDSSLAGTLSAAVGVLFFSLWVMLLWSPGESLLRYHHQELGATLDALLRGRVGPRTGRSVLYGLALGACLGGCLLLLQVAAVALPGCWPEQPSLQLPAFSNDGNVFGSAIAQAAAILLLYAVASRWLPHRWAAPAAALAAAGCAPLLQLHPLAFEVAANALLVWGLAALARRWFGVATLLIAVLAANLLTLAAFAVLHLSWMPFAFTVAAGVCAGLAGAGLYGLRRSPQVESEGIRPPAFIRRIEDERRLKYEMDLLARMQLGLLPQSLPEVAGWDIAARSLLATEAGGDLYDFLLDEEGQLWVAAGDVAGHGYSCAIVQAMTTAALTSLIVPGQSPSEVLRQVDRVIRRGGGRRNFTSLALLRLDPLTGAALLGNAGHPFPFLLMIAEQDVSEVALPSLPLGQGPSREYVDEALQLPPGAILVFCSDGLFEAPNWNGDQYGYDRPRDVLQAARHLTAAGILEAMLADWRRHLGSEASPDDTTILVIKRGSSPVIAATPTALITAATATAAVTADAARP